MKSGILLIITGWGELGKVIMQAVFSGTVQKFFRQRWLSPSRKNWPIRLWLTHMIGDWIGWIFILQAKVTSRPTYGR